MRKRRAAALAEDLPGAIPEVIGAYRRFLRAAPGAPEEPKEFGARHTAARTALAHLEQLLKILGEDAGEEARQDAEQLLASARADMPALTEAERKEALEDDAGTA